VLIKDLSGHGSVYDQIGPFGFLAIVLRTSIGDNEMADYTIGDEYVTLKWIIWLLIVIVGNIIFMNFIIAVVNESYENCMTTMVA
jgi:hypothetical protein